MITQARLKELLYYDPELGWFMWLVTNSPRALAGSVAGCVKTSDDGQRYLVIRLDGVLYRANRLAWLYVTGEWPTAQVDHEDRNGLHDNWKNLRRATNKQNGENANLRRDNTSGHRGVHLRRDTGAWSAKIKHNRQEIALGCYPTKGQAIAARRAGERKFFTHSEACK